MKHMVREFCVVIILRARVSAVFLLAGRTDTTNRGEGEGSSVCGYSTVNVWTYYSTQKLITPPVISGNRIL